MLEIVDGYGYNNGTYHRVTDPLAFLDNHFPDEKLEPALTWILRNGLRGQRFLDWFANECDSSNLVLLQKLIAVVDRNPVRAVLAGKDFR